MDIQDNKLLISAVVMDTADISYTLDISNITIEALEELIAAHVAMLGKLDATPKTQLSAHRLKQLADRSTNVGQLGELSASTTVFNQPIASNEPSKLSMGMGICKKCNATGLLTKVSGPSHKHPGTTYTFIVNETCKHKEYI